MLESFISNKASQEPVLFLQDTLPSAQTTTVHPASQSGPSEPFPELKHRKFALFFLREREDGDSYDTSIKRAGKWIHVFVLPCFSWHYVGFFCSKSDALRDDCHTVTSCLKHIATSHNQLTTRGPCVISSFGKVSSIISRSQRCQQDLEVSAFPRSKDSPQIPAMDRAT